MNLHTEVLRGESHREIGLLLQRHAARIVERWCDMARNEETAAQRVHYTVLRDELPMLLNAMGRALEETDDSGAPDHRRVAREHGAQRWENGWSLTEVVRDYQLLRLAVLEFLEQNLARALYNREAMAVSVYIDDAIAASVARYVAHRDASAASAEHERAQALEDLSRRKDEFLAILGHELRNPLAPIRNSVTVIRRSLGTVNPAVATSLDVLDRQSAQLGRLVDDLLDLARISRGEFELRKEKIDARVAIDQAVQMAEPLIKERGHQVRIATPARAVSVEADPHRVCQIAANLLMNAAKYTDPGGTIRIALEEAGEWVVLRVSDDGIGIAPEVLSHVFELFARAGQNEGNERDGLGIGLALVQRLVQQHGGTISAASDGPGKGAEFVVHLPKHGAAATPLDPLLLIRPVPFERS
jgi:signal transduction histidine kinase